METKTTTAAQKPIKPTRYITRKDCPCGAGRTSAILTERYPFGSSNRPAAENAKLGPVFYGDTPTQYGDTCIACRGCGINRGAAPVRGRISLRHTCGAKCLESKGFTCECSCGGKNHGAGQEAVVEPAAE